MTRNISEPTGDIEIILASTEKHYTYDQLGVDFDSSEEEILSAVGPLVLEEEGVNIEEDFIVKKVENSHNVKIFPKSTEGY